MFKKIYVVLNVVDIHEYYESSVPEILEDVFTSLDEAKEACFEKIQECGYSKDEIKTMDGTPGSICIVTDDDEITRWFYIVEYGIKIES